MDTVTQIALGGGRGRSDPRAQGELAGSRLGRALRAPPDLDVLWPFADPVSAFTWHRGYSHSFAVLVLATPVVAWAAARIHPATRPFRRGWLLLAFLALVTHPLLDCFTVYGTQVFLPFSDFPVGWSTIFIIDPMFSAPVMLGVLAALVLSRERGLGHRLNHVGLAIGVAWLALTVVVKAHVDRVAGDSLPDGVTRVLATPSPFNAVLWRVVAMTGDGRYLEGYYSLLDAEPRVSYVSRPDGHELLEPLSGEAAVARLMWFSRGFFSGRELGGGEIAITDLRMGFEERFVFSFVVGRREGEDDRSRAGPPAPGPGLSPRSVGRPSGNASSAAPPNRPASCPAERTGSGEARNARGRRDEAAGR